MKSEIIGICPSCIEKENGSRCVDIYVSRNEQGDITNMYIFGDDDFDVPANNQAITEIKVSKDGKTITEIVCPRCKEKIAVNIPVIQKQEKQVEVKPDFAALYADMNARQSAF
ncbi:MAG: hypothetical protein IKJ33_04675 [Clostridia bacterium]|nr:hypothetical protein [Clostridia bacterium]